MLMWVKKGNGYDHYFFIVLSVTFAGFIVNVDNYIVNIALPTITVDFGIDTGRASWIALSYMLAMVSTMLLFGKVADRIGSKKVFIAGYALFSLGSLLCGIAPGLGFLIVSRSVQGLGGSMLYVGSFAIISEFVPVDRRGWAFGMISASVGLGLMVSAPLGGFITEYLSWHWVFFVNVPVCIGAIVYSAWVIPAVNGQDTPKRHGDRRFDIPGAVLCLTGLLALVIALNGANKRGWHSSFVLVSLAIAALAIALFIANERRHKDPLLDFEIFRQHNFLAGSIDSFAVFAFFAGSNFLLPFFLERVKGLTSGQTGLTMMVYSVVYLILAPFAGRLSDIFSPRIISSLALASGSAASLAFAMAMHLDGVLPAILYLIWLAVSMAFFFPTNNNMVMRAVPQESLGAGTGAYRTLCHLGILMGVCLYETVFSHSVPTGVADPSGGLQGGASPVVLTNAFRSPFLFGCSMGIGALLIQQLLRKE
jgi:EmrB/QacA subfamily drug resistance transporter